MDSKINNSDYDGQSLPDIGPVLIDENKQHQACVLVTGGTGYLGAHTCVALLQSGYRVVIVDNLTNSKIETVHRIRQITGRSPKFYLLDIRDSAALNGLFMQEKIDAVIHFAGVKAVTESVRAPLHYYDVNVSGSVSLLQAMQTADIRNFVFSSSATVYGEPEQSPISEEHVLNPVNPYGRTKLTVEHILRDLQAADSSWGIVALRYFNPAGAHSSGLIGEDPNGIPNNLMPFISQVLSGKLKSLQIFGTDYDTSDGTAIRDYIHVMDLAEAHVLALAALRHSPGIRMINLGTGCGHSVLEVVAAYEAVTNRIVPKTFSARRLGDTQTCYANPTLAYKWLGWRAQRNLQEMCADAWRFQQSNDSKLKCGTALNEAQTIKSDRTLNIDQANYFGQHEIIPTHKRSALNDKGVEQN